MSVVGSISLLLPTQDMKLVADTEARCQAQAACSSREDRNDGRSADLKGVDVIRVSADGIGVHLVSAH